VWRFEKVTAIFRSEAGNWRLLELGKVRNGRREVK